MLGFDHGTWWQALHGASTGRLVPTDGNCFHLVVPAAGGELAHRFIRNNLGDSTTPTLSLGAPFGPWRYAGSAMLSHRPGDPGGPDL